MATTATAGVLWEALETYQGELLRAQGRTDGLGPAIAIQAGGTLALVVAAAVDALTRSVAGVRDPGDEPKVEHGSCVHGIAVQDLCLFVEHVTHGGDPGSCGDPDCLGRLVDGECPLGLCDGFVGREGRDG